MDLDTGNELLTPVFRSSMLSKTVQVLRFSDGSLPKHLREMAKSRAFEDDLCDTAILCPLYSKSLAKGQQYETRLSQATLALANSPYMSKASLMLCSLPTGTHQEHRSGFLLLGLNTRRTYDQEYQRFVRLLVNQLTTTLSTVVLAEDEARRARASARLAAQDRMQLVEKLAASTQGLRDSETRFRTMADLAPVGIFEFDASGNLLFANQRWFELTNNSSACSRDNVKRGRSVIEADRKAFEDHWHQLLNGEKVENLEFRLNRCVQPPRIRISSANHARPYMTDETFDGERLQGETWVLMAAYALRDESDSNSGDSSVKGVFGILLDISRTKWMEGFQVCKSEQLSDTC